MFVSKYGKTPFNVVVVHGGPGALGEMKPVAQELAKYFGVLEPYQSQNSVNGQIEELKNQIEKYANLPVLLVGYSWGAWLVYLLAAKYPALVKKIILVDSGPFTKNYAKEIMPTRMSRLNKNERQKVKGILPFLQSGQNDNRFQEFGELMNKADAYDLEKVSKEKIKVLPDIYQKVWLEAEELRSSGKLLKAGNSIRCPVVAIHGDHDPHPAEGVKKPLSGLIKNFRFILLQKCGHTPWKEKQAKKEFYKVLKEEVIT